MVKIDPKCLFVPTLVSLGYCNKLPQTGCPETTEIFSHTMQKARNQDVSRVVFF